MNKWMFRTFVDVRVDRLLECFVIVTTNSKPTRTAFPRWLYDEFLPRLPIIYYKRNICYPKIFLSWLHRILRLCDLINYVNYYFVTCLHGRVMKCTLHICIGQMTLYWMCGYTHSLRQHASINQSIACPGHNLHACSVRFIGRLGYHFSYFFVHSAIGLYSQYYSRRK